MKHQAILILALLIFASCSQAEQPSETTTTQQPDLFAPTTPPATSNSQLRYVDFSQVAERTINGVVHIKTEMTKLTPLYQSFFGMIIDRGVQRQTYNAFGSGVIISPDGYIVTNNHVVQDAERITVTLNDKRILPATLIGNDPATDLALLKIDATDLCYIPFGNSDSTRIGEPVLAIGNPFNLTSTVTAGIISAKARNMGIIENTRGLESPIESFLQTDAAVNSGNSGGALVNGNAQLIGINTAIASGDGYYTGYSFAIPSDLVQKVVRDLRDYGYTQRAYLGVNVADMSQQLAAQLGTTDIHGLVITRVIADCAADRAGLRSGDIILQIAGVTVNSFAEMMEVLGKCSPGNKVDIHYRRDNQQHTTTATLLNAQGNTQLRTR